MVEVISYKNLNGLSGTFTLDKKINVFMGSNGVGKTTSLDCLGLLLFGESFSYNKTMKRHINVNANKEEDINFEVSMIVGTDEQFINEYGKEDTVKVKFTIKATQSVDGKFKTTWFLNDTKSTEDKYKQRLCDIFNIPKNLLDLKEINVLRCLVDPLALNKTENVGVYNLIKALTNIMTVKEFVSTNEDYKCIIEQLANSNYDIVDCKKSFKTKIEDLEKEIAFVQKNKEAKQNEIVEINFDYEEYNNIVTKHNLKITELNEITANLDGLRKEYVSSSDNDNLERDKERKEKAIKLKEITDQFLLKQNIYNNNTNHYKQLLNKKELISNNIKEITNNIVKIETEEFVKIICPNCQEVINKNELMNFENVKKQNIEKLNKLKIEKEQELENVENEIKITVELVNNTVDELQTLNEEMKNANEELANATIIKDNVSENTLNLKKQISIIETKKFDIQNEINEYAKYLENCQMLLGKLNYLKNQIESSNLTLSDLRKTKALYEQKQFVINQFNLDYTKLLEEKISSVFGDIKINMIKEGKSVNAKLNCYAIQDDKPIYNYNTAPQIALGCKMIKAMKDFLKIKDLPIMFDIVDNIGENSLNDILKYCDSQLVCTKVIFSENNKLKLINNIKEIN